MQEIAFSIPVSGVIRIDEENHTISITVNKGETLVTFEPEPKPPERISLPKGITLYDIVLEAAQSIVKEHPGTRFTAAQLAQEARKKHPDLNS